MPKGMCFTLEGDANDYLAKGCLAETIILYPPQGSSFQPGGQNIITGNVAFYARHGRRGPTSAGMAAATVLYAAIPASTPWWNRVGDHGLQNT
jgi:hypothetical protein